MGKNRSTLQLFFCYFVLLPFQGFLLILSMLVQNHFFSFTKFISLSLLIVSLLATNLFKFLFVNKIPPKATRQTHMNKR